MSAGGRIVVERDEQDDARIARLIIDHAGKRNAMSLQMWRDLTDAVHELDSDPAVRSILIRGAGEEAFAAGADISEFESIRQGAEGAKRYDAVTDAALRSLRESTKPVIAAVRGFCFGGGCAIILSADLRIGSDDSQYCIPAAKLGLAYGAANTRRLVQELGAGAAREMLFTANVYDSAEALRLGLIHRRVANHELFEYAAKYARRIAANAPLTVKAAKLSVRHAAGAGGPDAATVSEAAEACFKSADYEEGVRAFLEKRKPQFSGS